MGIHSITHMPFNESTTYLGPADVIRDQDLTKIGTKHKVISMAWRPSDISDSIFQGNTINNNTGVLVYIGSGLAPGQTVVVRATINYEYMPLAAYADLLDLSQGPSDSAIIPAAVDVLNDHDNMLLDPGANRRIIESMREKSLYGRLNDTISEVVSRISRAEAPRRVARTVFPKVLNATVRTLASFQNKRRGKPAGVSKKVVMRDL